LIAGGSAAVLASLPVLWGVLHDYQRRRFLTLLDPSSDPLGAGITSSSRPLPWAPAASPARAGRMAPDALEFIPNAPRISFRGVFRGIRLIGATLLLVLYLALIMRGLMIAANAPTFSRGCSRARSPSLLHYAAVNMGMVSGLLPVVGCRCRSSATAEPRS